MGLRSLYILVVAIGVLAFAACGSKSRVSTVKAGTIAEYPNVPLGKAFDASFDDPKWTSDETAKGVKFVEFDGRLKLSKHKEALDKEIAKYSECAAMVDEVKRTPNYAFVKYVVSTMDQRGGNVFATATLRTAEMNKYSDEQIAELYNSDPGHVFFSGNIGSGSSVIDKFVKKIGDLSVCGPDSVEKLASVKFQFQFTPDGKSFSLTFVDMLPWKCINLESKESVLKYVLE